MGQPIKKSLQESWQAYVRDVLPADVSELQKRETRKGFYAGATAVFAALVNGIPPGRTEATLEDVDMIEALYQELEQVARDPNGVMN